MNLPSITDVSLGRLTSAVNALGLKPYAAGQIISWLYKRRADSFDSMSNLSLEARDRLKKTYGIKKLRIDRIFESSDGTKKFLFELEDRKKIESVLIPAFDGRVTLCVSTQAGCAMGCSFCRTGLMGFERDLTQGEILGQLIEVQRHINSHLPDTPPRGERDRAGVRNQITNIVFMGMGEPLVNFGPVADAIDIILDERAFNFSKRRVTVSTSGLIPQLKDFADRFDIKLAVSLNATDDKSRNRLMPVNRRYPIRELMEFCREFTKKSRRRITFEYVMLKGINDTSEDMKRLIRLLEGIRAKVNLIPFNPFNGCEFEAPLPSTVENWFKFLLEHGIQTNIRVSRGQDILAACGQLAA
jgi:23S rRNA (adenine2503-C2)-methyltransferase